MTPALLCRGDLELRSRERALEEKGKGERELTRDPLSIVVSPKEGEGDSISGDIRRWSDGAPKGRRRRRNVSHVIRKDFALFALGFRCGQIPRLESTCVQSERSREKVGLLHFLCSDTAGREIRQ